MKKYTSLVLLLVVFFSSTAVTHAAWFQAGDAVTIPQEQIVTDNVYAAGKMVTLSSTAQKDVAVAGGKVIINGPVWGDIGAAGGSVDILQPVRGDVRVVGGTVTISSNVSGDVVVAGGTVNILPGATVAGDLVIAGGKVSVEGPVNGKTKIYGGQVSINALLAGAVTIHAKELAFKSGTIIGSTVTYVTPMEVTAEAGAKMGDHVTFIKSEMPKIDSGDLRKVLLAVFTALFVIKLISIGLTVLVAVSVFPKFSQMVATETLSRFWHMVLVGFGAVVVGPPAVIVLCLTIVGVYAAIIVGSLYMLAIILGGIYLCIVTGALLSKLIKKDIRTGWKWALLGTVVVFAASLVPVIGWIATGILYFAAVGSMIAHFYREVRSKM